MSAVSGSTNVPRNSTAVNQGGAPQQVYVQKKVIENYSYCLPDEIGKGYSSRVYQGKNETTGEVVAVKVIDMKGIKNEVQNFLLNNEISVLKKLNQNINCLRLIDVIRTINNTYIITEFCDHGDLKDLLKKYGTFTERPAVRILKHLLGALDEMKTKGIIHRDLKLANILVREGVPKIADFGFSKDLNSEPCRVYYNVGTPMYMCPQSLTKNEYSFKSDIWSLGVLFYEMMCGSTPWMAESEQQLVEKMLKQPVAFPPSMQISNEAKDFIVRCLTIDESKRISLEEMHTHPVFKILENKTPSDQTKKVSPSTSEAQPKDKNKENNYQQTGQKGDNSTTPNRGKAVQDKMGTRPAGQDKSPQAPQAQTNYNKASNQLTPLTKKPSEELQGKQNQNINVVSASEDPEFSPNDQIILAQINFCRFLYRLQKGCLDTPDDFQANNLLKEKVVFLILKNIMIKMNKLNQLCESKINSFNMNDFQKYTTEESYTRFCVVIREYNQKYGASFNRIWEGLNQDPQVQEKLLQDKKFAAIFDQSFIEFESFYIIAQGYLRSTILELNSSLGKQLSGLPSNQTIPDEHQNTIVFLDYLITYLQLSQLILEKFNQFDVFARISKIEQIAEGKPVKLSKFHFTSIQAKINSLEI